jgi:hypothetical protein
VYQQRPRHLPDPRPHRDQHLLAVPPGPEFVLPEYRTHPVPEPPRVAAVAAPGRQPGAQPVVVVQHGPVPQPLGDLARSVDDERPLAPARHPVHPALAGTTVPDAGRAEPRSDLKRGHDMPGLVPGRLYRRRPRWRVARRRAQVIPLPDPPLVHDRLVVVPDQPGQVGANRRQAPRLGWRHLGWRHLSWRHSGDSTQNSLPSGSASTVQETSPWPISTGTAPAASSAATAAA